MVNSLITAERFDHVPFGGRVVLANNQRVTFKWLIEGRALPAAGIGGARQRRASDWIQVVLLRAIEASQSREYLVLRPEPHE